MTSFPTSFHTGALRLRSPFLLAPLEGVSDAAFRRLCFLQGAAITYTEMIRARGIAGHNRATLSLIDTVDEDVVTGIQLLATGPDELQRTLSALDELAATTHPHFRNIVAIDLNFGCPSPDVIRAGAGPALLKRRSRMRALFEVLAGFCKQQRTLRVQSVSAKIRLGLHAQEQEHKVYLPVVEMANDTLHHITIHARHAKQKSRDAPTWSAIGEAKAHAKIPVVGNGDVRSRADAEKMFRETGCDGFLIARAAIASPWCFHELQGQKFSLSRSDLAAAEAAAATYDAHKGERTNEKFKQARAEIFARLRAQLGNRA